MSKNNDRINEGKIRALYVDLSEGEYEGTKYRNLVISNGLRAFKIKAGDVVISNLLKPEDEVDVAYELVVGSKEMVSVRLVSCTPVKTP